MDIEYALAQFNTFSCCHAMNETELLFLIDIAKNSFKVDEVKIEFRGFYLVILPKAE